MAAASISQYYRAIQELWGMEEFKVFADKLLLTAENAAKRHIVYPPLPNLIFAATPGVGVTKHLHLLTGLLKEKKLMRFSGETDYFEATIRNPEEDFDRLLLRTKDAAGFYGNFRGVVGIDLTALFKDCEFFGSLRKLMEYVDYQYGRILFVFVIPLDVEPKRVADFVYQFTSYSPIELIHMPFPDTNEVLAFIRDRLKKQNLGTTQAADKLLIRAIDELRKDAHFEGFQTLNNLIDALVWNKLSSKGDNSDRLTEADIAWIFEEDEILGIVRTNLQRGTRPTRIGFVQGK